MLRKSIYLLSVIQLIILMYSPLLAFENYSYTVRTDIKSIHIVDGSVNMDGGFLISEPGAPKIGYRVVKLVLPQGKSISGFSIVTSEPVLMEPANLDYVIGDLKTGDYPADTALMPDPRIFGSNRIYPENRVEILDEGTWGEINLVSLAVYPVGYKPLSGEILFYPEINVIFRLEQSSINPRLRLRGDGIAYGEVNNMVENKTDLPMFAGMPPVAGAPKVTDGIPSPEYIIVTSAAIAPGFYPFLEWKNQKGIPTDLVLIEDILASTPGSDPAEQLRNYLIQAYNDGVRWVLLGGDEDVVPIRYLYTGNVSGYIPELCYQQISDLYYGDLTGDWDLDGDGVWGESFHDAPDIYPELYVGRVPARAVEQAQIWSAKAVTYESNPGNGDPSYLLKALFVCSDQMRDYGQHYELANLLPDNFLYDVDRLEETPSGGAPVPTGPYGDDVINVMNEGWGFISNLNHGSPEWYASRSKFYNSFGWSGVWGTIVPEWNRCGGLIQLTTFNQPAIHYSISCDMGAIDFDKGVLSPNPYATTYTFAEAYLFEPGAGIAFLGNTRWGWVTSSYYLEMQFIEHIFVDSTSRISEAEILSKIDYPNYRDLAYGHTLFGDPEMRMWTHLDGNLLVEGPTEVNLGQPVDLTYTVFNDTSRVQGAQLCIYIPGDTFELIPTDENGEVTITLNPGYDGIMTVTATKQNYIPAQLDVIVGSPAGVEDEEITIPGSARIYQNYPNPFNNSTMFEFELPEDAHVDLVIYDIRGRLVKRLASRQFSAGTNKIVWDGLNENYNKTASGIYFFRFSTGNTLEIKQMTLLK